MILKEQDKRWIIQQTNKDSFDTIEEKVNETVNALERLGYVKRDKLKTENPEMVGYARQFSYLLEDYQVATKDVTVSVLINGEAEIIEIELLG